MCSAVRGCVVQGEHVCESTLGDLPWGYPKREHRLTHGEIREELPRTKMAWTRGPAYADQHERPCQSQSLCIPILPLADPNALQKSSLLQERPCAKRLQPSFDAPLHTPPTLVQLKPKNFQVGNLTAEFQWTFSVATVLHSLTQRCVRDMRATYVCFTCLHLGHVYARSNPMKANARKERTHIAAPPLCMDAYSGASAVHP